jgi:TonB family protein
VAEAEIAKSSGFPTLDQAALDVLRHAGPFALSRPLGRPSLTIKIPINYSLGRS